MTMYEFWQQITKYLFPSLPTIFNIALLVIVAGVCYWWVSRVVTLFLTRIRFSSALERIGLEQFLSRFDLPIDILSGISILCGAFFPFLFAIVVFELLGLSLFAGLLEHVVLYYPNILISLLILVVSVYAIDLSQKIFVGTKTFNTITYSRFLSRAVDWAIRILVCLAVFYQLGIIPQLIIIIFAGIILTASLAVGLSLGLAGKEPMARFLKEIGRQLGI